MIVAHRLYTEQEPPILSIVPAQTCFNLARLAGSQEMPPKSNEPIAVFCVNSRSPAPIRCLFRREAGAPLPLVNVAQRLGGEFSIEQAVVVGEAAKVPNTKLSSHLGDSRPRRISGFERSPNLTECSEL